MSRTATAGRQISLLALCQALLYVNNVTLISINGLAGLALASTPVLATLPVTTYIFGSALTTLPASLAMARWGRRAGFMFGAAMAIAGTSTAAFGMLTGSFALLCLGTFCTGIYNAFAQYLRFAAVDVADAYDPALKERAIAWVLAGGIAGGLVGPELSKLTSGLLPVTFAASYMTLAVVALLAGGIASRLVIPRPPVSASAVAARPLGTIARQPTFILAVMVGAISYGGMNLLMTATPLAMKVCGFGYPEAADVIKWHVVGMFAPGFFSGHLVRRFGTLQMMLAGCGLMLATVGIAHAGLTYWHFWFALFALGVGWNFMFVGATSLLTTTYATSEKAKVQGVNDLTIFLTMITSSAASGALVSTSGWTDLNLYALPALLLAAGGIVYLMMRPAATPLKSA
ncbi:MAG: MFS transporter [Burkholderiaceae bacterium]|nr:MFS transporter [Burkholderiaceae bacterium]MDH5207973.1 MFS transporter [Burkholderiaceae bacterium]